MKKIVDGNKACADVAYLFSEIASIYPITPSSPMAQEVDVISHTDKKNLFGDSVRVVEMQSEAGAAGTMHGALLTGSLATTFTASQGLLLMIPNMYKMAGECLPGVIHVAARTVATHALSIFGDHSDIYATRATGFCMLASTNVEDANHLAAVAHLSAIEGSLPFLHFFDGFRTSHEVNTIDELNDVDVLGLINHDKVYEFKNRMLNVGCGKQKGMAENEDIYFQSVEARNELYNVMPDIVNHYMEKINELTGKSYKPFNYYGAADATNVIVAMGSVCDTAKLVVDDLVSKGEKVGLIEVHLYRPFSSKYLLNVLPESVKRIAVLDRTKEAGASGEPLYLDVCSTLKDKDIEIVGGRYGLSSKNTDPAQIYAVYCMLRDGLKNNFTIGIEDDVTNLSLKVTDYNVDLGTREILIYGFGSDGMVSTSKDIMHIIGEKTNKFVQSYNQYDSKKSGGVTICNLRIGDKQINAPYYVTNPGIIVITKEEYLFKFDMIDNIKENGIVVINTNKDKSVMNDYLPNKVKDIINKKHVKLYIIDADKIALECNIKGKISKIMQMVIMDLIEFPDVEEIIGESIEKQFATKGEEIINSNKKAITMALENLVLVDTTLTSSEEVAEGKKDVISEINARRGDNLKVSELINFRDGTFPGGLSSKEKRKVSALVPKWDSEKCIQCGQCAIVCPHAVIRPFAITDKEKGIPMLGKPEYNFVIEVSEADCTSCGLCINACLGKGGEKALAFGPYDEEKQKEAQEYFDNYENPKDLFPINTVKGSQFVKPKFEFSGACAGCGETPYTKLLTQLFGDKLVIANATGCSSIYGGSAPSTPYSIPWANSLFEDNAEFGFGMKIADEALKGQIIALIKNNKDLIKNSEKDIYKAYCEEQNEENANALLEIIDDTKIEGLLKLKEFILPKSVWMIGGDGWAYDIGYNGIDHVLASKENVNILVLDTEVYSNTGGQASKSTRTGAVAKFAAGGKETAKKNLAKIAMSYPHVYVGTISLGANAMQAIKVMKEAEAYNGPSIIIAYAPCIAQGIIKGMKNSINEEKLATESGYFPLLHYNPENKEFKLDSKADFTKYEEFTLGEDRYRSLKKINKEGDKLLDQNRQQAEETYDFYQSLTDSSEE